MKTQASFASTPNPSSLARTRSCGSNGECDRPLPQEGASKCDLLRADAQAIDAKDRDVRSIRQCWAARIDDENSRNLRSESLVCARTEKHMRLQPEFVNERGLEFVARNEWIGGGEQPVFRAVEQCCNADRPALEKP